VAQALACFGEGEKSSGRASCAALNFRDLLIGELPFIVLCGVVEDAPRDRFLLVARKTAQHFDGLTDFIGHARSIRCEPLIATRVCLRTHRNILMNISAFDCAMSASTLALAREPVSALAVWEGVTC
jgi:hypothetical protein